jgi:pimeloyl-ACP methyl ester carboxylesterase
METTMQPSPTTPWWALTLIAAALLCSAAACRASGSTTRSGRGDAPSAAVPISGYTTANGLRVYYESYGSGRPLVLLHGGLTNIQVSFSQILPTLARSRRIIAIEQQGHGHTADRDAPLSFAAMTADTAAVLRALGISRADFLGFSDGGVVALQLAIRHPELVGKLVLADTGFSNGSLDPQHLAWLAQARPEDFAPLDAMYKAVAPDPAHWPTLVNKWKRLQLEFEGIAPASLRSIQAPALILAGDRGVRAEHTIELYRHLANAQLAILPGADHFLLASHSEQALGLITGFLDAPPAQSAAPQGGTP